MRKKAVILYFLVGIILFLFWYFYKPVVNISSGDSSILPIPITQDMIIKKEFTSISSNISKISIRFGTYQNEDIYGKIEVKIYQDKNKIYEETIDMSKLTDNAFYDISLSNIEKLKSKKYTIELYGKNITEENEIAIWGAPSENGVSINGEAQNMDIGIIYTTRKNDISLLIYFPLYIAIICLIELFRKGK